MEERKCIHPRASVAKMFSEGGSSSNKGCIEEEGRRSKVTYMNEQCVIMYMLISLKERAFRQTSETINLLNGSGDAVRPIAIHISIVLPESMQ
jgi:hypothetical protein